MFRLHDVTPLTIFPTVIVVVVDWRYGKILNFETELKQGHTNTKHFKQHFSASRHHTNMCQTTTEDIDSDYSSFRTWFGNLMIIYQCITKYSCPIWLISSCSMHMVVMFLFEIFVISPTIIHDYQSLQFVYKYKLIIIVMILRINTKYIQCNNHIQTSCFAMYSWNITIKQNKICTDPMRCSYYVCTLANINSCDCFRNERNCYRLTELMNGFN